MAFSKRIRILASLIEPNKNIVDIGCDHALLDIYLTLYNHNSCIATDINEKAIQHAKENIKKYNSELEKLEKEKKQKQEEAKKRQQKRQRK